MAAQYIVIDVIKNRLLLLHKYMKSDHIVCPNLKYLIFFYGELVLFWFITKRIKNTNIELINLYVCKVYNIYM